MVARLLLMAPLVACGDRDSDGDGLSDHDERQLGTDPDAADTDRDGYSDRDEVSAGSDPADDGSVIYTGGWPYYFDKDALDGGEPTGIAEVGRRFARFALEDQFGDRVDLFDFYNADKPVVIDVSAQWCAPCIALSTWLGGGDDPDDLGGIWSSGPEVVGRGDVYWITVLPENADHLPATRATVEAWAAAFPSDRIPVLTDGEATVPDYVGLVGWPTLVLLEPSLEVSVLDRATFGAVLEALGTRFPP